MKPIPKVPRADFEAMLKKLGHAVGYEAEEEGRKAQA
jgi:hypothetical protein